MENCEPECPRPRDASWRQGINFQSPDQDRLFAEFIDGSHDYRITGNRGTQALAGFDPAMLRTTGFLQSDATRFDAEGNFEVIVSREKPAD